MTVLLKRPLSKKTSKLGKGPRPGPSLQLWGVGITMDRIKKTKKSYSKRKGCNLATKGLFCQGVLTKGAKRAFPEDGRGKQAPRVK